MWSNGPWRSLRLCHCASTCLRVLLSSVIWNAHFIMHACTNEHCRQTDAHTRTHTHTHTIPYLFNLPGELTPNHYVYPLLLSVCFSYIHVIRREFPTPPRFSLRSSKVLLLTSALDRCTGRLPTVKLWHTLSPLFFNVGVCLSVTNVFLQSFMS